MGLLRITTRTLAGSITRLNYCCLFIRSLTFLLSYNFIHRQEKVSFSSTRLSLTMTNYRYGAMEWRSTKRNEKAKNVRKSMLVGSLRVTNEISAFPVSRREPVGSSSRMQLHGSNCRIPSLNRLWRTNVTMVFPGRRLTPTMTMDSFCRAQ
jgi:hypothetical protein